MTRKKQTKEISSRQRSGLGRVAFLSLKDEIKEKLDAGYTAVLVFEEHQYYLGISYSQFVRYINKFIRGKRTVSKSKEVTREKETHGAAETKPQEGATTWKPWAIHEEDLF